jgi:Protein of unknown function (DUF3365)/HAMP domain
MKSLSTAMPMSIRYARELTPRLRPMKFIVKFNLILVATLAVALVAIGLIAQRQLEAAAHTEALISARMMLGTAMAATTYTTAHVAPLLENQMRYTFLPESVGSFAATELVEELRKLHPEYGYREAVLNPTNPRDRANEWETELVTRLRAEPGAEELVGRRGTGAEERIYLARRLVVTSPTCLQCHGSLEAAPKTLVAKYGSANGFGWQLNETIGARVVTMPARAHVERAQAKLWPIIAAVGAAFVVLIVALNGVLVLFLLRPLTRLAETAEQASMGAEGVPEFEFAGNDQIAMLSRAFARMRTSLQKAITMIDA